jgi:hypothetical protein
VVLANSYMFLVTSGGVIGGARKFSSAVSN